MIMQVEMVGHPVCRDTICANADVLIPAIQELGNKVSVDTLNVHIRSFYKYIHVTPGCSLELKMII